MPIFTDEFSYTGMKVDGKKALILCILQTPMDYSDEEHPMTFSDIIGRLKKNYGIEINPNTVGRNISTFCSLGFDISTYKENRRGAFIYSRQFDAMEIRWIINVVINSKYLTEQYAADLIAKKARRQPLEDEYESCQSSAQVAASDDQVFLLNMELLDEAIEKGLRARFVYNRMDCDAKLYPTGNPHEVLPLHMFCAGCSIILLRKTSKPKCCCISGLTG